jgi:hypothetical protein
MIDLQARVSVSPVTIDNNHLFELDLVETEGFSLVTRSAIEVFPVPISIAAIRRRRRRAAQLFLQYQQCKNSLGDQALKCVKKPRATAKDKSLREQTVNKNDDWH